MVSLMANNYYIGFMVKMVPLVYMVAPFTGIYGCTLYQCCISYVCQGFIRQGRYGISSCYLLIVMATRCLGSLSNTVDMLGSGIVACFNQTKICTYVSFYMGPSLSAPHHLLIFSLACKCFVFHHSRGLLIHWLLHILLFIIRGWDLHEDQKHVNWVNGVGYVVCSYDFSIIFRQKLSLIHGWRKRCYVYSRVAY